MNFTLSPQEQTECVKAWTRLRSQISDSKVDLFMLHGSESIYLLLYKDKNGNVEYRALTEVEQMLVLENVKLEWKGA